MTWTELIAMSVLTVLFAMSAITLLALIKRGIAKPRRRAACTVGVLGGVLGAALSVLPAQVVLRLAGEGGVWSGPSSYLLCLPVGFLVGSLIGYWLGLDPDRSEPARVGIVNRADLLEQIVVGPLRRCISRRLKSVTYRCVKDTTELSYLGDPESFIAGELALVFDDVALNVCWDECAGWETHFSVRTSEESIFDLEGRMDLFDGALVPMWHAHITAKLSAAEVRGWGGVPYAVVLRFPEGSVLIGSAAEDQLGDGDDLIIRDAADFSDHPLLETMWRSGAWSDGGT